MARRRFVRGIAILSLVIIAAGCAEYVLNLRTKRKAEALLRDARTLEIGKSTEEDVQRIVARYGGESGLVGSGYYDPSAKPHSVYVANSGLNWLGRTSRLLRPFGNRHWSVEVAFLMNPRTSLCRGLSRPCIPVRWRLGNSGPRGLSRAFRKPCLHPAAVSGFR